MSYILGIDESQFQGIVNHRLVKDAGYRFAIIRMSGSDAGYYYDTRANYNYYDAKGAGMLAGGYHVAGGTNPEQEADYFYKAMQPLAEDDLLALDIEPTTAEPSIGWPAWAKAWCGRIHDLCGVWPFVYLNISQSNGRDYSQVMNTDGLWCAAPSYGFDATLPVRYPVMMQQGPAIRMPGITANVCDIDAFFGTTEELRKYGWHAPVVTAPVEPTQPTVPAAPVEALTTPPLTTIPVLTPATSLPAGTAIDVVIRPFPIRPPSQNVSPNRPYQVPPVSPERHWYDIIVNFIAWVVS